jgi:hypothetical protein
VEVVDVAGEVAEDEEVAVDDDRSALPST